jgi:hypothetical protein
MEWGNVMKLLKCYEWASGQKLNNHKTAIYFSHNTRKEFIDFIRTSSGTAMVTSFEKYLGLPVFVGRAKVKTFEAIKGRVQQKFLGWKEFFLSQVGKEVLLKAVAQDIPIYSMSVFQLPKGLYNDLNSLMNRFWWGKQSYTSGVHWKSWVNLSLSKEEGMGFWDLTMFNMRCLQNRGGV